MVGPYLTPGFELNKILAHKHSDIRLLNFHRNIRASIEDEQDRLIEAEERLGIHPYMVISDNESVYHFFYPNTDIKPLIALTF